MSGPPEAAAVAEKGCNSLASPLLGLPACGAQHRPCLDGGDCPECPEFIPGCCEQTTLQIARHLVFGSDVDQKVDRTFTICWFRCTGNMQVLLLSALLFGSVTATQTFGAVIGNSKSLLEDSMAMWIDVMTYILNMFAEAFVGCRAHKWMQVIAPMISLSALSYFTFKIMQEALDTLNQASLGGSQDEDDVNAYIVMFFSLWCFFSDGASIAAFFHNYKDNPAGAQVNMMSALAHVGADFARSVTTFVEAILIMGFNFNGAATDAWACIIVSIIILLGIALAAWKWLKAVRALFSSL